MTTTQARPVIRSQPMMGSVVSAHVHDDASSEFIDAVISSVFEELSIYESMFSTFQKTSEISRINLGDLHILDASREVIDVLDACFYLEGISKGAFSAHRVDGSLDPAGFVKGWAVERASRQFDIAGLRHWYVSLGGDMQLGDPPLDEMTQLHEWKVGIADPHHHGAVVMGLSVERGAVATSGTAERSSHLVDPRSGQRCHYWSSVTVTGPSLTWADAFATVACVLGENGLNWVHHFEGYSAFGVRSDGKLVTVARSGEIPHVNVEQY